MGDNHLTCAKEVKLENAKIASCYLFSNLKLCILLTTYSQKEYKPQNDADGINNDKRKQQTYVKTAIFYYQEQNMNHQMFFRVIEVRYSFANIFEIRKHAKKLNV